jgi:polyferredoxin
MSNKPQRPEKSSSTARFIIQLISLAATILIGIRHIMPGESSKGGAFDAFCPFGGIETFWSYIISGRTLLTTTLLNFSILLGVLGVSALAGRAFCGWFCPVGTLQDLLANFTARFTKRNHRKQTPIISAKNSSRLRLLKYLVLGVTVIASIWTLYPPLHDICPARALFSFQVTTPLLASVLITFIATSLVDRRIWCKYLCPLGGLLAPINKLNPLRLVFNEEKCTDCRQCDSACPMEIVDLTQNLRSPECIQCLECQTACKEQDAISLQLL